MLSSRSHLAVVVAVVALVASAVAASPAGGAPPGQGLVTTPFNFTCEGIGATTVTTIRGGPPGTGPAWITASGLLALVQEITITSGGTVIFEKTYGNKAGLGATFTCTATLPNGFFLEAELVAVT
jgi:hypothetical protein